MYVYVGLSVYVFVCIFMYTTDVCIYVCVILVDLPLALIARLDRVLRCAARLIGRMLNASISAYMRDTLHWLPIAKRISYRLAVLVLRCRLGSAPAYLCELCRPLSGLPGRRTLHSSVTGQLLLS